MLFIQDVLKSDDLSSFAVVSCQWQLLTGAFDYRATGTADCSDLLNLLYRLRMIGCVCIPFGLAVRIEVETECCHTGILAFSIDQD